MKRTISKTKTLGIAVITSCSLANLANAQKTMVGGPHDFSNYAWAEGEICKPCHTPHFANSDVGYLWNHELTVANYELYRGPGTAENDIDTLSRLCLSCHDGTVALDSFGGKTGTSKMPPVADLKTDLANDHPIGRDAVYPEAGSSSLKAAIDHKLGNGALVLRPWTDGNGDSQYVVSCLTCHTPHNMGFRNQLRMKNSSSALCLACHLK